jgi:hypothetical protein
MPMPRLCRHRGSLVAPPARNAQLAALDDIANTGFPCSHHPLLGKKLPTKNQFLLSK